MQIYEYKLGAQSGLPSYLLLWPVWRTFSITIHHIFIHHLQSSVFFSSSWIKPEQKDMFQKHLERQVWLLEPSTLILSHQKKKKSNQVVYWYCRFVFFLSRIIFQWCLLVSWKDSHTYLQTSNSQSGDLQMFRTSVRFIHGMDYRRQQEQRLPTESDITDFL